MIKLKEVLTSSRVKSFCWRLAMMLLATGVDFLVKNLTDLNLGVETTVILGLVLGEVSKALNNKYAT